MSADHCATCGRPRGVSLRRRSWGTCPTVYVPRTGNPGDHPAQIANDLICSAAVYRNGGTGDSTHLCDECLRVGLRALKLAIDRLLGELDEGRDKDAELAELTDRLARLQLRHYHVCFDHDRMQSRLSTILARLDGDESEDVRLARWESDRGCLSEVGQPVRGAKSP